MINKRKSKYFLSFLFLPNNLGSNNEVATKYFHFFRKSDRLARDHWTLITITVHFSFTPLFYLHNLALPMVY